MKRKFLLSLLFVCTAVLALGIASASADTYGKLTYKISNRQVIITECDRGATYVVIPNKLNGYPVTVIGDRAFSKCNDTLKSVTIPDSVTTIGESAFYFCTSLKNITIPNSVTTIGAGAFSFSGLTEIYIPDSVTDIGVGTFAYCQSLTTAIVGNGVTAINNVFYECTKLASIKLSSATSIGGWSFYKTVFTHIDLPENLESIDDDAFRGSGIKSITIPDNVKSIGNCAFYGLGWLKSVTFGSNVKTIGSGAFAGTGLVGNLTLCRTGKRNNPWS